MGANQLDKLSLESAAAGVELEEHRACAGVSSAKAAAALEEDCAPSLVVAPRSLAEQMKMEVLSEKAIKESTPCCQSCRTTSITHQSSAVGGTELQVLV